MQCGSPVAAPEEGTDSTTSGPSDSTAVPPNGKLRRIKRLNRLPAGPRPAGTESPGPGGLAASDEEPNTGGDAANGQQKAKRIRRLAKPTANGKPSAGQDGSSQNVAGAVTPTSAAGATTSQSANQTANSKPAATNTNGSAGHSEGRTTSNGNRGFYSSARQNVPGASDSEVSGVADGSELSNMLKSPVNGANGKVVDEGGDRDEPDAADAADLSGILGNPSADPKPADPADLSNILKRPSIDEAGVSDISGMVGRPDLNAAAVADNGFSPYPNARKSDAPTPQAKRRADDDDDVQIVAPAAPIKNTASATPQAAPVLAQTQAPVPEVASQPPIQVPPSNGSVPVMQVPVPQFVPMPMPVPMPVSGSGTEAAATTVSDTDTQREEITPKLPKPDETGAEISMPVEKEPAEEEARDERPNDEPDVRSALERQRQLRAAKAYRFFQNEVESAREALLKKQEPFTGKTPRLLNKHIANLENLRSQDTEEIIKLLNLISRSESVAAIQTFREYGDRRQDGIRIACAKGLAKINDPGASLALLDMLADGVSEVVDASVLGLLHSERAEVLSPLLALALVHPRLRNLFRGEFSEMPAHAQDSFKDPLRSIVKRKSEIPDHSALALHLLSQICGTEEVGLYTQYAKHPAPELRVAAIEALAATGEKKAVGYFNKGLADKAASVRSAAASALSELHSPKSVGLLVKSLRDTDKTVRRSVAKTLASLETDDAGKAAAAALKKETDPTTVEHLLEIIGKSGGDNALGTLKKYLGDKDVEMRHRAIATIRKLKSAKGVKLLSPLLEDGNADTRRLTAEALGQLGSKSVVESLRHLLRQDPKEQVRAACARALGDLKDEASIPTLEDALDDGRLVKCQAIIAMGAIGSEKAQPALLAQLRNAAPEVRYHACNALGQIGNLSNTQPVEKLLDDKDAMVRRGAENALEKLGLAVRSGRWKRNLKRRFAGIGSALMPSSIAGGIPGGVNTLFAICGVILVGTLVFAGGGMLGSLIGTPGSNLPTTRVDCVTISGDGHRAFLARTNGVVDVWSLEEHRLVERFKRPSKTKGVLSSLDGEKLLLISSDSSVLLNVDDGYSEAAESQTVELSGELQAESIAGDGKSSWIGLRQTDFESHLALINLSDLSVSDRLTVPVGEFSTFAVAPDKKMAVVASPRQFLLLAGEKLEPIPGLELPVILGLPEDVNVTVRTAAFDDAGKHLGIGTDIGIFVLSLPGGELASRVFEGELDGPSKEHFLVSRFIDGQLNLLTSNGRMVRLAKDFSKATASSAVELADAQVISLSATEDFSTVVVAAEKRKQFWHVDVGAGKLVAEVMPDGKK